MARLRTHAVLTAAGIPCVVVLDSAVAYIMERVDMVLVGSEAVVESGVSFQTHHERTDHSPLRASFPRRGRTKQL